MTLSVDLTSLTFHISALWLVNRIATRLVIGSIRRVKVHRIVLTLQDMRDAVAELVGVLSKICWFYF